MANAQTTDLNIHGALIKIQDDDGDEGFSDLCPWPTLGDLTLEEEIKQQGELYKHALYLAELDLLARKNKIQLVSAEPVKNNKLIADFRTFSENCTNEIVKIKGDKNFLQLAQHLNSNFKNYKKIRLDFNFSLTEQEFIEFFSHLNLDTKKSIQYIEDPFPFDEEKWKNFNGKVKLALDWKKPGQNWNYLIQKPSREKVNEMVSSTLTSAMEHPVGLVHALHWAQKYPLNINGFLTLDQFEKTEFHNHFKVDGTDLVYNCDGYGIGFSELLKKQSWIPHFNKSNFLLLNPRINDLEKKQIFEIKKQFNENLKLDNFILIPSSGSQKKANESVKVIALKKEALMHSAARVNAAFQIDADSVIGNVLPLFHVGGLGMLFRSQLSKAKLVFGHWESFHPDWILEQGITHISLVPTQIYEIVKKSWIAPDCLKVVFVGGAAINKSLAEQAVIFGWNIIQTFGMTETGSMIATKKPHDDFFDPLPGVLLTADDQKNLKIKCDSLASFSLRLDLNKNLLAINSFSDQLLTNDKVELKNNQFLFLQREQDYIKIKGEGVSLFELRSHLEELLIQLNFNLESLILLDLPDLRDGQKLVFIFNDQFSVSDEDILKICKIFNDRVRPYEKVTEYYKLAVIPKSELGKVKFQALKEIILSKSSYQIVTEP